MDKARERNDEGHREVVHILQSPGKTYNFYLFTKLQVPEVSWCHSFSNSLNEILLVFTSQLLNLNYKIIFLLNYCDSTFNTQ